MTPFEFAMTIIGVLMSMLGTIGTIFLIQLLGTLKSMGKDVNGIKVSIAELATTQSAHEDKFDNQDKRIEKIEEKIFSWRTSKK